jgi:hypothetical protein
MIAKLKLTKNIIISNSFNHSVIVHSTIAFNIEELFMYEEELKSLNGYKSRIDNLRVIFGFDNKQSEIMICRSRRPNRIGMIRLPLKILQEKVA